MASAGEAIGALASRELRALLDRSAATSVFLVTGKSSWQRSGAEAALAPALEGRRVERFCDFSPNPDLAEVERGAERFRDARCDIIVAVGGGSALDLAKLVNAVCAHPQTDARDIIVGVADVERAGVPMIAIPTTAGSGAEVTHFAAVYVDGAKHSVAHASLRPTHALLDASLTASLSPYLTAATGMDALSQAIESCWSVGSTEESRDYSLRAARLCAEALRDAATAGTPDARERMLEGAHLAGKAIDIAKTTAPHALSYAITSGFGVTHGHAVALTLGAIFGHNADITAADSIDPRGPEFVRERIAELAVAVGASQPAQVPGALSALMSDLGLAAALRDHGVARSDLPRLASTVNAERLANNPRALPPETIGAVLESVY